MRVLTSFHCQLRAVNPELEPGGVLSTAQDLPHRINHCCCSAAAAAAAIAVLITLVVLLLPLVAAAVATAGKPNSCRDNHYCVLLPLW
jgi:hypothetical protein